MPGVSRARSLAAVSLACAFFVSRLLYLSLSCITRDFLSLSCITRVALHFLSLSRITRVAPHCVNHSLLVVLLGWHPTVSTG